MVIKRIDPLSVAKVGGALYVLLGIVIGAILSLIASIGFAGTNAGDPQRFPLFFGVAAILWAPLFYGAIGFIGGLITSAAYNVLARFIGGVSVEIE